MYEKMSNTSLETFSNKGVELKVVEYFPRIRDNLLIPHIFGSQSVINRST